MSVLTAALWLCLGVVASATPVPTPIKEGKNLIRHRGKPHMSSIDSGGSVFMESPQSTSQQNTQHTIVDAHGSLQSQDAVKQAGDGFEHQKSTGKSKLLRMTGDEKKLNGRDKKETHAHYNINQQYEMGTHAAEKKAAYVITNANKWFNNAWNQREALPDVNSIQECANQVKADSDCSNIFYHCGGARQKQHCRCMRAASSAAPALAESRNCNVGSVLEALEEPLTKAIKETDSANRHIRSHAHHMLGGAGGKVFIKNAAGGKIFINNAEGHLHGRRGKGKAEGEEEEEEGEGEGEEDEGEGEGEAKEGEEEGNGEGEGEEPGEGEEEGEEEGEGEHKGEGEKGEGHGGADGIGGEPGEGEEGGEAGNETGDDIMVNLDEMGYRHTDGVAEVTPEESATTGAT